MVSYGLGGEFMKKFKKIILVFVLVLMLTSLRPWSVSANAPPPADYLTVEISDLPEGAVYADLLIQFDADDANYVDFQPNHWAADSSAAKEIAEYSTDGYRSFTFHYKNAKSNIELEHYFGNRYCVDFCNGSEYLWIT